MVLSKLASTERLFTLPLLCVLALVFPHVRSSHQKCSVKKDVLRNFGKFTGKHLCQSRYFNKVAGLRPLSKQRLWHSCFPVNFAVFLRTPFQQNTSGRLLLLSAKLRSSITSIQKVIRRLRSIKYYGWCTTRISFTLSAMLLCGKTF